MYYHVFIPTKILNINKNKSLEYIFELQASVQVLNNNLNNCQLSQVASRNKIFTTCTRGNLVKRFITNVKLIYSCINLGNLVESFG